MTTEQDGILEYLRDLPRPGWAEDFDQESNRETISADVSGGAQPSDPVSVIGDLGSAYLTEQIARVRADLIGNMPAYATGAKVDAIVEFLGRPRQAGESDDEALINAIEQDVRPYPVGSYRYLTWLAITANAEVQDAYSAGTEVRIVGYDVTDAVVTRFSDYINDHDNGEILITDPALTVSAPTDLYAWSVIVYYDSSVLTEQELYANVVDACVSYNRAQYTFDDFRHTSDLIRAIERVADVLGVQVTRFNRVANNGISANGRINRSAVDMPLVPVKAIERSTQASMMTNSVEVQAR